MFNSGWTPLQSFLGVLKCLSWKVFTMSYQGPGMCLFSWIVSIFSWTQRNWEFSTTWSEVWIGNFNVKAWKPTEHKLHKIWRSLNFAKFQENEHTPGYLHSEESRVGLSTDRRFHQVMLKFRSTPKISVDLKVGMYIIHANIAEYFLH